MIQFNIPVPPRVSSDIARARAHNVEWSLAHGLITSQKALERYSAWRMAELGAFVYPDARGDDLDLAVDALGWFTLFDDQFDGPLGSQPDKLADVCRDLIRVMDPSGKAPDRGTSPIFRAWEDVWSRSVRGMSEAFRIRAARNWTETFWGFMAEAEHRVCGAPPDFDTCLFVRGGTIGTYPWMDLVERTERCELPAQVAHTPRLQAMMRIAADLSVLINDVYSVERERAREDPNNLVFVLEDERRVPRKRALDALVQMAHDKMQRFTRLSDEVPAMLDSLRATPAERDRVIRYVRGVLSMTRGHLDWYAATERYGAAEWTPASKPGYSESILA
jgi:hypothetical protein